MLKWWHRLTNPHCVECEYEKKCKSCETLQFALEQANREKHDLLNALLKLTSKDSEVITPANELSIDELKPRFIPWRIRQAELEANDRATAKLAKDKAEEMKSAEKDYTVKVDPAINKLEEEVLEGAEL